MRYIEASISSLNHSDIYTNYFYLHVLRSAHITFIKCVKKHTLQILDFYQDLVKKFISIIAFIFISPITVNHFHHKWLLDISKIEVAIFIPRLMKIKCQVDLIPNRYSHNSQFRITPNCYRYALSIGKKASESQRKISVSISTRFDFWLSTMTNGRRSLSKSASQWRLVWPRKYLSGPYSSLSFCPSFTRDSLKYLR